MEKLFDKIRYDGKLSSRFFYFCLLISVSLLIFAVFCLVTYINGFNYIYLLSARELILSSFGVFIIGITVYYVLGEIFKKFKE